MNRGHPPCTFLSLSFSLHPSHAAMILQRAFSPSSRDHSSSKRMQDSKTLLIQLEFAQPSPARISSSCSSIYLSIYLSGGRLDNNSNAQTGLQEHTPTTRFCLNVSLTAKKQSKFVHFVSQKICRTIRTNKSTIITVTMTQADSIKTRKMCTVTLGP